MTNETLATRQRVCPLPEQAFQRSPRAVRSHNAVSRTGIERECARPTLVGVCTSLHSSPVQFSSARAPFSQSTQLNTTGVPEPQFWHQFNNILKQPDNVNKKHASTAASDRTTDCTTHCADPRHTTLSNEQQVRVSTSFVGMSRKTNPKQLCAQAPFAPSIYPTGKHHLALAPPSHGWDLVGIRKRGFAF